MREWLIDQYTKVNAYSGDESLFPENMNVSGGIITNEDIDKLKDRPHIKAIDISGLRQDTFDYFIDRYGQQFEIISFWKCPLITDLSKLSALSNLKCVVFFWNQRAETLWDMSGNHSLRGVFLNDFSRLHNLDDLCSAPMLEELHFGDAVWDGLVLNSLKPLQNCRNLKYLTFSAKKIIDNDLTPLSFLTDLEELWFSEKLFSTEQIAWLKTKLPNVESRMLAPFITINPIEWKTAKGIKYKDTLICGKGKPFLDSNADHLRIEKYADEFRALVEHFRLNPQEPCPIIEKSG